MRAFFAVALTSEARDRIAKKQASVQGLLGGEPVRWVRAETLHLTLRFLGEVAPALLEKVERAAAEQASSWRAFDLRLQGLGCFPDPRRPRVIWIGAYDDSGRLLAIAEDLERIAQRFAFRAEERPFSPHLTIARVKDRFSAEGSRRLASLLEQSSAEDFGGVPVPSVDLMRSELRPAGPIYTKLAGLKLGP